MPCSAGRVLVCQVLPQWGGCVESLGLEYVDDVAASQDDDGVAVFADLGVGLGVEVGTVDGLIYASSMVMLDSARRGARVPALARWLLGLGIVATLAANVAHSLGHGIIGAAVAAWPAVALVGSYELLMVIIRGTQPPVASPA